MTAGGGSFDAVRHERDPGAHVYVASCRWSGSTAGGYEAYDRAHEVLFEAADTAVRVSADQAFMGDARLVNPEQLLVASASSCQLLSFLAVAARARVVVTSYEDQAEGFMPSERPKRVESIVLRPKITVSAGTNEDRVLHLVDVAHRECYIANSLTTEVLVLPSVTTPGS